MTGVIKMDLSMVASWLFLSIVYCFMENIWCHYRSYCFCGVEAPQRTKNRTAIGSSNPTAGFVSRRTEIRVLRVYLCPMFIAALLSAAKLCSQPECPSTLIVQCVHTQWLGFSFKKGRHPAICGNMDESGR